MRLVTAGGVVVGVLLTTAPLQAELSVGAKAWYADVEEADNPAFMVGPVMCVDLDRGFWISGTYLWGRYAFSDGTKDLDTADAEVVLGYTASVVDVGLGARYALWRDPGSEAGGEFKIWGPMAYVGVADTFGDSAVGWYAAASWMFKDFGDARDLEHDLDVDGLTFEHWNAEAGLFLTGERVTGTFGYRHKAFVEEDYDVSYSGVAASVAVRLR